MFFKNYNGTVCRLSRVFYKTSKGTWWTKKSREPPVRTASRNFLNPILKCRGDLRPPSRSNTIWFPNRTCVSQTILRHRINRISTHLTSPTPLIFNVIGVYATNLCTNQRRQRFNRSPSTIFFVKKRGFYRCLHFIRRDLYFTWKRDVKLKKLIVSPTLYVPAIRPFR